MRLITIEQDYETQTVSEGKLDGARLEWRAAGLDVFIKGKFTQKQHESAANLAMNVAIDMHIPVISLRRQTGKRVTRGFASDTMSKKMF